MKKRSIWRLAVAAGFVVGSAASSAAQFGERTGSEFRVNSSVGGSRSAPRVAMALDGRLLAVWTGTGSGGVGRGIMGRRFDSGGVAEGNEFRVDTTVTADQDMPDVAMDAAGASVVVWQSLNQDGPGWGVFAQRFDAGGGAVGTQFRVNTTVLGDQDYASVAMDALGRFVVCWRGATSSGSPSIFGQRFDASGNAVGLEFEVGAAGTFAAGTAVAMNAAGRFVVAWSDTSARARSYDEFGTVLGPAISLFPLAYSPRVGIDDAGRFVLVFGDAAGGPSYAVFYDASGARRGFLALTTEFHSNPGVATNGSGDSLVTGALLGGRIYAQTLRSTGDPQTWPLLVNPVAANDYYPSSLAIGGPGLSVVVWRQTVSTGVVDILAQRYGPAVPPPPMSFHTLVPCRVLDTRGFAGQGGPLIAGAARLVKIADTCGLPSTAKAIAANLVVTRPTAAGHLSFLPGSGSGDAPVASAINYGPGETRSNNAILPVNIGGELRLRCVQANGAADFILDVVGYFE